MLDNESRYGNMSGLASGDRLAVNSEQYREANVL